MFNYNYNSLLSTLKGPAAVKTIDFLVAAAGGLGGNSSDENGRSGGGGAGGVITGNVLLEPNQPYEFTIGVGQYPSGSQVGKGYSSSFETSTGVTFGVGGGAPGNALDLGGASGAPNSFAGGTIAGGGGGATSAGTNNTPIPNPTKGGDGGTGITWLDGNGYSGGGYGLLYVIGSDTPLTGSFGAPSGSYGNGGGAGRAGKFGTTTPGNGVGVVRYSGTPSGTGGQIVFNASQGYTYHYFTSSGVFVPFEEGPKPPPFPFGNFPIQLQVVGGGGAGSVDIGGGGGAGGVRTIYDYTIDDRFTYSVVVGQGHGGYFQQPWNSDPPTISNASGSNSFFINNGTFDLVDAWGGGNGGKAFGIGNTGGSGGGGSGFNGPGGGIAGPSLANVGGNAAPDPTQAAGGGGGASTAGLSGLLGSNGGDGVPIIGFNSGSLFVGGGGAGGNANGVVDGGIGGGGDSGTFTGNPLTNIPPQKGQANTGGGGGGVKGIPFGAFTSSFDTGGGSGIVVIFYKGIQQAFGGQIETRELNDGFYTQHIFTASGQFVPISN